MNKDKEFSEYIKKNFSSVAKRYDLLNHLLSFGMDKSWRKKGCKILNKIEDGIILDLCTGTSDFAISCEKQSKTKNKILGIDFSNEMLLLGKRKTDKFENVFLIRSDTLKLPLKDDTADGILIGFGLRNLFDLNLGLEEMFRVLKPEGSLVILEFSQSQVPFFSQLYNMYFRHVLPIIGGLISGNKNFYKYLHDSVQEFPDRDYLVNQIKKKGFEEIKIVELTFGVVSLYHFRKFSQIVS